jgi:hypothetical protein
MPTPADPAAAKPRVRTECPRCGYDLSGVLEGWWTSRLSSGICSECGTSVNLCDLLARTPKQLADAASFERDFFEVGRHDLARRFVRTSLRLLFPPSFFPWLDRSKRTNWPRLWRFFGVWAMIDLSLFLAPVAIALTSEGDPLSALFFGITPLLMIAPLVVVWLVVVASVSVSMLGYRKRLVSGHHGRLAIYAACGLMCVGLVFSLLQVVVLIAAGISGLAHVTGFTLIVFLIFLVYLYCWAGVWCRGAVADYFGFPRAKVVWLIPIIALPMIAAALIAAMAMA